MVDHCRRNARWVVGLMALWAMAATALQLVAQPNAPHVAHLTVRGAIGPATADYVRRAHTEAQAAGARALLVELDTPGGLVSTTRDLAQLYLHSEIPVITWVGPAGARAASAGTYLVYASHLAAMAPSTTIGAATPVQLGGLAQSEPPADPPPANDSAAERKALNDAVAWIRSLAERHGRNAQWAEQAVREAATLTASEAVAHQVVELLADSAAAVLEAAHGREVVLATGKVPLDLAGLPLQSYEPDWRTELLSIITNPQIAYILLLVGIYGLLLEGYSPGALVPGTVGIIALLLALYALQLLPVNYAGLALIAVGAGLMAAEAFAPSFGILGIGGIVALAVGSLLLMDSDVPGFELSRGLILGVTISSGLALLGLLYFTGRALRQPQPELSQDMVGMRGAIATGPSEPLQVMVRGERWQALSETPLQRGQPVEVVAQQGLTLRVRPLAPAAAPEPPLPDHPPSA